MPTMEEDLISINTEVVALVADSKSGIHFLLLKIEVVK
jgi:hypothetical protein